MGEIERIVDIILEQFDEYDRDNVVLSSREEATKLATALEQHVIKARKEKAEEHNKKLKTALWIQSSAHKQGIAEAIKPIEKCLEMIERRKFEKTISHDAHRFMLETACQAAITQLNKQLKE